MSTFLVTQATGQQSQWVIKHLLAAGAKVHAVVRDPQKIPTALKQEGITIFKGESVNYDEVLQAARGCSAAYLNTFPWPPSLEVQQAKTIVAACKEAGIETIVASTTFTVGERAVWDDEAIEKLELREYFTSKAEVEAVVRGGNFKAYTFIRPAVLISDFFLPGAYFNFPGLPASGELDQACGDDDLIPFTDPNDVGKYVAAALQDPAKFSGQAIDLLSGLVTLGEVRDILARVSGRDVRLKRYTAAEAEAALPAVFGMRFQLMAALRDLSAYLTKTKEAESKFGIPTTSIEAAVQREKARLLECLPE